VSQKYMSVEQAAQYIQDHRFSLHYDDRVGCDLFTWGVKAPITLRRAIVKHRQELLRMMSEGDKRVCPSPVLHKYARMGATCEVCRTIVLCNVA
jgi:hypothetical protein